MRRKLKHFTTKNNPKEDTNTEPERQKKICQTENKMTEVSLSVITLSINGLNF